MSGVGGAADLPPYLWVRQMMMGPGVEGRSERLQHGLILLRLDLGIRRVGIVADVREYMPRRGQRACVASFAKLLNKALDVIRHHGPFDDRLRAEREEDSTGSRQYRHCPFVTRHGVRLNSRLETNNFQRKCLWH